MWAKIKGALFIHELVVLSAILVFAGTASADDGLNSHLAGGIAYESGIENADVKNRKRREEMMREGKIEGDKE